MHCPNCGYCPHCGRSNQPALPLPYPTRPHWQIPQLVPLTPTYPTYAPFPTFTISYEDTTNIK